MEHQTAQALVIALTDARVTANAVEELNLWCVVISVGGRRWCSVIGNDDELTWGEQWEHHVHWNGNPEKAVKAIKKTVPSTYLKRSH